MVVMYMIHIRGQESVMLVTGGIGARGRRVLDRGK